MTRPHHLKIALAALAVLLAATPGEAEQTTPTCLYASRSYSNGAFLCVQKSVALICRSDGGRLSWTTVTDKDLADRCTAPVPHARTHHARVRTAAYRIHHRDPSISPARCFDFNGKRYCE
ncbi:DUF1496 domain-containing protein [Bradyrhizobium diazoefficiens]|nr:DUF1496 domain-containing protein [Bradyrhizobium diazoefficiens]UCF54409.1 MAG: DUF1496 domain-containing protein [Bradyrhizobium sp.]MBR0966252.1 DUF1496 domain-containing protein [Bradyrhizobium diazoefficiens]MBR0979722.1 DUF1496 domain-containing protein [Bradyrhizobium diazoefficiens]MBR1009070.1 DUF1496 domain-containing protein [Bradyrhizobium diazoefficiens]MBR1012549.1 DUF1496 domain-containing protein [Bradyrhizobium diazoefficiens]